MPQWNHDLTTDRQGIKVPAEDPDYDDLAPAFPPGHPPDQTRSSSRPSPQITPSARILELTAERDLDMEPVG